MEPRTWVGRQGWWIQTLLAAAGGVSVVVFGSTMLDIIRNVHSRSDIVLVIVLLVVIVISVGLSAWVIVMFSPTTVVVDDWGVTVRKWGSNDRIEWGLVASVEYVPSAGRSAGGLRVNARPGYWDQPGVKPRDKWSQASFGVMFLSVMAFSIRQMDEIEVAVGQRVLAAGGQWTPSEGLRVPGGQP